MVLRGVEVGDRQRLVELSTLGLTLAHPLPPAHIPFLCLLHMQTADTTSWLCHFVQFDSCQPLVI